MAKRKTFERGQAVEVLTPIVNNKPGRWVRARYRNAYNNWHLVERRNGMVEPYSDGGIRPIKSRT